MAVGHDGLLEAIDDPSQYSISRVAQSSLPIFIPWHREQKHITCGFQSVNLTSPDGPWKDASPFLESAVYQSKCQTKLENGAARDVEGHSASNSITSEHLSGSLGVSVGNAVVEVGVTASYDQQMQELTNASRASHSSGFRCGRIILVEDPPFSNDAKTLLQREDGDKLFAERYGDYFVSGYVLGADSGGCLAASASSKRTVETLTTEVNVKVLWISYTSSTSTTDIRQTCSMDLTFYGYDTLNGTNLSKQAQAGKSTQEIQLAAQGCIDNSNNLQLRLKRRMSELGIEDEGTMSVAKCSKAVEGGVVVELILTPFRTLKEYIHCIYEGKRKRAIQATLEGDEAGQMERKTGR
ncbi:hypothetical protein CEP52_006782 [Fusarium oligoseptatum]|uniref:Uncharacterized protein n=1 Tax=Fusarium oligoseptatum TaxID=2604345 RepID=A0A428TRB4_9HYPO|nr:hypothetical protein CEP52_006782 [Fusarium oligoseptatum]